MFVTNKPKHRNNLNALNERVEERKKRKKLSTSQFLYYEFKTNKTQTNKQHTKMNFTKTDEK